jgi:hypothetical protein
LRGESEIDVSGGVKTRIFGGVSFTQLIAARVA